VKKKKDTKKAPPTKPLRLVVTHETSPPRWQTVQVPDWHRGARAGPRNPRARVNAALRDRENGPRPTGGNRRIRTRPDGAMRAVNLGDDADTTGAVYGQLAGAFYGVDAIPREWSERLAMRDVLEDLADRLFDRARA
jgi:ADP-ribosylglycohydrolase